jgi:hypothetical protein
MTAPTMPDYTAELLTRGEQLGRLLRRVGKALTVDGLSDMQAAFLMGGVAGFLDTIAEEPLRGCPWLSRADERLGVIGGTLRKFAAKAAAKPKGGAR